MQVSYVNLISAITRASNAFLKTNSAAKTVGEQTLSSPRERRPDFTVIGESEEDLLEDIRKYYLSKQNEKNNVINLSIKNDKEKMSYDLEKFNGGKNKNNS